MEKRRKKKSKTAGANDQWQTWATFGRALYRAWTEAHTLELSHLARQRAIEPESIGL